MMLANATHSSNVSGASATMKRTSPRNTNTLRQNGAKIAISTEDSVKGSIKRVEEWISSA